MVLLHSTPAPLREKPLPKRSKEQKNFEQIAEDVVFHPTDAMREAKSAFWAVMNDEVLPPHEITLALVKDTIQSTRIATWWNKPGFQAWFLNKEEYKQRLEYLMNIGMDALERVLRTSESDTAIVSAMKLIIAANDKMPKAGSANAKTGNDLVDNMTDQQVDDYIRRQMKAMGTSEASEGAPVHDSDKEKSH